MSELISIIVPIYKVELYLKRCIDSILKQSYKNLEIILVNDGSPDKCGEICDDYSRIDNRIKVIHKKNGGISEARNSGIDISHGAYITFIDSDDWINELYIEELYCILNKSSADISICSYIKTTNNEFKDNFLFKMIYEYSNIEALEQFTDKFYVQMVIATGKLYKRTLFEGIRFPIGKIHEDEFTTYKLIFKAKKIVLTTAQLYYYWQREDSITGVGFSINNRLDGIEAFIERAEFFKNIGLIDLSWKTYRSILLKYIMLNGRIDEIENIDKKLRHINNFKNLKHILRKSKQKIKFKVFYELYYIAPQIMGKFFKLYQELYGEKKKIHKTRGEK